METQHKARNTSVPMCVCVGVSCVCLCVWMFVYREVSDQLLAYVGPHVVIMVDSVEPHVVIVNLKQAVS